MKKYNKLIRDKIPEIITSSGKQCLVETLNETEFIEALDAKLIEELYEYQADKSLEELADLLEVIYAVSVARGYSIDELESVRKQKVEKRPNLQLNLDEQLVLTALADEELHYDDLIQKTQLDSKTLNSLLVKMEIKGLIQRLPGNEFCKKN